MRAGARAMAVCVCVRAVLVRVCVLFLDYEIIVVLSGLYKASTPRQGFLQSFFFLFGLGAADEEMESFVYLCMPWLSGSASPTGRGGDWPGDIFFFISNSLFILTSCHHRLRLRTSEA